MGKFIMSFLHLYTKLVYIRTGGGGVIAITGDGALSSICTICTGCPHALTIFGMAWFSKDVPIDLVFGTSLEPGVPFFIVV